ncbi:AAA family ATPase [Shewanella sp. DW31]|uniref:AAA family ATPase n=1 Tax=Shewanella sp. DW31 TaxID=2699422 RepID=UPI0018E34210|nr:AAA family ATPase [Shewanella sp. DW31]MBI1676284.1 AAA family ATPase [Shewanella sp. DW31]
MDTIEPIKLKSLVLNNIRRFGTDVEIKFGAGATILIAPNGSGKTAVLEAIELALTSDVKRVAGRWAPLIREGGNEASVQIDFGDWQREVSVTKDRVSVINEGRLDEIFNDISPDEIPFLLRLTHLLDQRDTDWFCQQGSVEAGGQLSMLPLGRQASQISATVARLKPAVSRRINELSAVITSRQQQLDDWNALLRVRDSARTDLSKPLIPLSVLSESLKQITNPTVLQELKSIAAIREHWAIANTVNSQNLASIDANLNNLAGLVLVPVTYGEISESLDRLQKELQTVKSTQGEYLAQGKVLSELIESADNNHRQLIAKSAKIRLELDRRRTYEKTTVQLATQRQLRDECLRSREQKKEVFETVQQVYTTALTAEDTIAMLNALAGTIMLKRDALATARQSYAHWKDAESRKRVEEQKLRTVSAKIDTLGEKLRNAVAEVESANAVHQSATSVVSAYQDAVGAIRAAVSTVAEKLPVGTDTCPVCLEAHGEQKLRNRISTALQAIDPRLIEATAVLRLAAEKLETAQKAQQETKTELNEAQTTQVRLNETIASINSEVKTARANSLLIGFELEEARGRLDALQKEVDDEGAELDTKRATQEPPVSVDIMTQLTTSFNSAKRDLAECEETLKRMEEEIKDTIAALNTLDPLVVKDATFEQVEQTLKSLDEEIRLSAAGIEEVQAKKSATARALLDIDATITRIKQQVDLDQGRLEAQRTQWVSVTEMLIPPSSEQLETAKEKVLQDKARAEAARSKLSDIEMELNRIAQANSLVSAQQEVDAARGENSEDVHARILMEALKKPQEEHALASQRKNALDEFHAHLTSGIEIIRDKISDVVPYWQAILRRIVQEPRFSGTNLNYYKSRTKDHASIQVSLGNELVGVADIASQAQMTDLQLSFMLSMATVHQWSPWKALLLDDPTQHHDLVHASSVFDVLRDFISELNFQVVLTTHDAQQARFLMRKLNNDGIDVRLWKLEPSENGMTAKQIGGIQ